MTLYLDNVTGDVLTAEAMTERAADERNGDDRRFQPITHYTQGHDKLCLACGDHEPGDAETCDADDYHDEGCDGRQLECDGCGDPLFPAAYAEYEAEHRYMAAQYRSGALGASIGRTRDAALEAMQRDDPVAFYIACKDDPDAIEAEVERRVNGR